MTYVPQTAAWRDQAACRGKDPDLFFPHAGEPLEPARAICATCPVFEPCYLAGLHERHGVWAGTSERERDRIRRQLGIHLTDHTDEQDTA